MGAIAAGGNEPLQLKGARELQKGLRKAGIDLKDLRDENLKAAQIVARQGKATAPVKTGRLARTVRAGANQKTGIIRAGTNGRVPYANPIHWGWHGTDAKGRRHNITGRPWLTQSAKDTESEWVAIYRAGVQRIIDRIQGA